MQFRINLNNEYFTKHCLTGIYNVKKDNFIFNFILSILI